MRQTRQTSTQGLAQCTLLLATHPTSPLCWVRMDMASDTYPPTLNVLQKGSSSSSAGPLMDGIAFKGFVLLRMVSPQQGVVHVSRGDR